LGDFLARIPGMGDRLIYLLYYYYYYYYYYYFQSSQYENSEQNFLKIWDQMNFAWFLLQGISPLDMESQKKLN
jgi:hypothetical protein